MAKAVNTKAVNPQHRRIYVSMRIKQIREELKDLKPKIKKKAEPGAKIGAAGVKMHRENVFTKLRINELRKELVALQAEYKTMPKKTPAGLGDFGTKRPAVKPDVDFD